MQRPRRAAAARRPPYPSPPSSHDGGDSDASASDASASPPPPPPSAPPPAVRGRTPVATLAPGARDRLPPLARAGPHLHPLGVTSPVVAADFAAASGAALAKVRAAVAGTAPLDVAAALAAAGAPRPPAAPPPAAPLPPAGPVPLGPGGGRGLEPGTDVLITVAISEYGRAARPLATLVLVASSSTWADVATHAPCPADAALASLGTGAAGRYVAAEGVILVDAGAEARGGPDLAAPILAFLEELGTKAPAPPDRPAPEARPARGRPPAGPRPWAKGALADAPLSTQPLRAGGGAAYVFCHQGGCEHALAVRDVRLATAADAATGATLGDFPLLAHRARPPLRRLCCACRTTRAAKAVWDSARAPGDPSFWCGGCYARFHYDAAGALAAPHRVVDYVGG
jgi:hypothetical protein